MLIIPGGGKVTLDLSVDPKVPKGIQMNGGKVEGRLYSCERSRFIFVMLLPLCFMLFHYASILPDCLAGLPTTSPSSPLSGLRSLPKSRRGIDNHTYALDTFLSVPINCIYPTLSHLSSPIHPHSQTPSSRMLK